MKETTLNLNQQVWIPLPRQGERCPISGLQRGRLLTLITEGKIKSSHLREGNAKRGSRLVHVESLLAFIESHATAGR